MTSLSKTMENAYLSETKKIIYHSQGIDESYPKMYFLLNLSHYVKNYGHLCQFLAFLLCPLSKYDDVTWPKKQISKKNNFFLILHLISGKVTKFLVEKLLTSEVINQKPHEGGGGGGKHPLPSAFRVKMRLRSGLFVCLFLCPGRHLLALSPFTINVEMRSHFCFQRSNLP